jgi:hypothetical protein
LVPFTAAEIALVERPEATHCTPRGIVAPAGANDPLQTLRLFDQSDETDAM